MTVAIAAICHLEERPLIIATEDRMMTAGDIEFEQPQSKMWRLNADTIALMYGDMAAQTEIAGGTELAVARQAVQDVESIAELYAQKIGEYTRRSAEELVLRPLGMSIESFLEHHQGMQTDLTADLIRQLQTHAYKCGRDLGGAIVAGVDDVGAHIWQVEYGELSRLDRIGFLARGSGRWHAESEFMFAGYTPAWDFPEALSLVYSAKKRAEVAPGVGRQTDVVLIFSSPPNVRPFPDNSPLVQRLEEIYSASNARRLQATDDQHRAVREFMKTVIEAGTAADSPSPTPMSGQENEEHSNAEATS